MSVLSEGKVGFFWLVPSRLGGDQALGDALSLKKAERYGEALTHPTGHYEFWQEMQKRGPAWLRARNVSGSILANEYEDWPRGRVTYQVDSQRYNVLAHPSIFRPSRLVLVIEMFNLQRQSVALATDLHYGIT